MLFISDRRIFQIEHPFINSVSKSIIEVPIVQFAGAREKNCILNAKSYAEQNSGSQVITGYIFSSLGNVLVRAIGHAVVLEDGQLRCVTPPERDYIRRRGTQYFLPYKFEIEENGRLPAHTIAVDSHPSLERFALMENIIAEIKMKHPARASLDSTQSSIAIRAEYIEPYNDAVNEMKRLIPVIEQLALASMHRNNLCHCGSGKKYKSCCI